jgi:DNA-binding NarL/FixJ family response regulator
MVVDDQAVVRAGFAAVVDAEPDLTVVAEAGDGATAVALAQQTTPDVVLMDIRMPGMDGLTATRLITALHTSPKVLVLTTFDLDVYVYEALRAGSSGFMLKDALPEDVLSAIRVVAAGEGILAPTVTRRLIGQFARPTPR